MAGAIRVVRYQAEPGNERRERRTARSMAPPWNAIRGQAPACRGGRMAGAIRVVRYQAEPGNERRERRTARSMAPPWNAIRGQAPACRGGQMAGAIRVVRYQAETGNERREWVPLRKLRAVQPNFAPEVQHPAPTEPAAQSRALSFIEHHSRDSHF